MKNSVEDLRTIPNLVENAADILRAEGYDDEAVAVKIMASLVRPWFHMVGLRHRVDLVNMLLRDFRRQYIELTKLLLGAVPEGTLPPLPPVEEQRRGTIIETISEGIEA